LTEPAARTRPLRLILALAGVALVVLASLLYLNRRTLAREALTGWLRSKGIASEAEVYAIGPSAFTARLRIGDPTRPDFTVSRAEVRYRLKGLGFEVVSVTLREPLLRASLRGGRFSVGSLDPLVEEFRRRPPRPDAAKPRIAVDDGTLLLASDYGSLRVRADALVQDNRLITLSAVADPARLRGRGFAADLGRSTLSVRTRGGRADVRLDAPVTTAGSGDLSLRSGRLQVTAEAPYPDLVKQRGDGALTVHVRLTGAQASAGERTLDKVDAQAGFVGRTAGWIPDLVVSGKLAADVRADAGDLGGAQVRQVRAAVTSDDLRWSRKGGDRVTAALRLTGSLDRAQAADLTLQKVTAALAGPLALDRSGLRLTLAGSALGHGRWEGLGPPAATDTGDMVAVKRAARGFRIAAPGVRLALAPETAPVLGVSRPVVLRPDAGGEVRLASLAGGAWRLTSSGGGLPQADLTARDLALAGGGVSAALAFSVRTSMGPVEQGVISGAGRLRIADGGATFTAARCVDVAAAKLEFGENDIEKLSGRLCPTGEPLVRFGAGGWRIAGRAEAVNAAAPFLQARIADASGRAAFGGRNGRLQGQADISAAKVLDAAPEARFHPLAMTGQARLVGDLWTADLDVRLPEGAHVMTAALRHDGASGQGGVDLDTGMLVFAEGGLQPLQISPLAAAIGSPATGQARFTGGFAWNPDAGISAGELVIPRLDFQSPAGRITGLSGKVVLTSLAPLVAAPGQELRAERIDAAAILTNVTATFGLKDEALQLTGGVADVGAGKVRIESLELPFDRTATVRGVLRFEGVQLHDIVEASPFGDKVELDAKVSGRIPFESTGNRVRVTGGDLKAIQPGRLSIRREALTTLQAPSGTAELGGKPVAEIQSDTFADFAYQAMENLAFDELDATINSRSDGRLGVLFHIKGRHDPPKKQEIRLSLMDLIQRKFLGRKLPLPSNTGVNLTLDTTLNLDDLLADYAEYQRLRSSGPVQP